jgi:hypothetical protein
LHHTLLPFGVALLAAATAATVSTTTITVATTTALLLLLLPFGCRWNVGRTRYGVGIGLGGGICHGLSRNQN